MANSSRLSDSRLLHLANIGRHFTHTSIRIYTHKHTHLHTQAYAFTHTSIRIYTHKNTPGMCTALTIITNFITLPAFGAVLRFTTSQLARRAFGTPKDNGVEASIDKFLVAFLEYHLI